MADEVDRKKLRRQLVLHEGYARVPYVDTVGIATGGIGRNFNAHPFSDDLIDEWYEEDVAEAIEGLDRHLPWWRSLTEVRQRVLIDMAFNLGITGLLGFHRTLACVEAGDWEGAASGMEGSKWYRQVKGRGKRLCHMMRTGEEMG